MLFASRETKRERMKQGVMPLLAVTVLWATAVAGGMTVLMDHSLGAGDAAQPPATWPGGAAIARETERPTIVVLAHPQCPCSRATIDELARLMAHAPGRAAAHVVFAQPDGVTSDWVESELWAKARAIPGVTVRADPGGAEARRFGGATSGQTLLYDADGELRFSGGITAARGHAGDNAGSSAVSDILLGQASRGAETPVFGCPLEAQPGSPCPQVGEACTFSS